MKILTFHVRVKKITKIFRINLENNAINENHKIPRENHENHKIQTNINEYHDILKIPARITKIMKI